MAQWAQLQPQEDLPFSYFYKAEYYQRHDNGKYEAYYNGCDIV